MMKIPDEFMQTDKTASNDSPKPDQPAFKVILLFQSVAHWVNT